MKRLESVKFVQFLLYEKEEFRFDEITGIFGRNGSGKSSALDGVQIALLGANKNLMAFNAQADAGMKQQNRTLRSYCLGQYGDDPDQCARNSATTYITLIWRDTDTKEPVSMGVCIEASRDSEDEKVLGRYVVTGLELSMSDHLQTVDGVTEPLPWASFHHRLRERAEAIGQKPFADDASSYVKQALFALRGKAGQPTYETFARAFRFALRMKFDKSVDQIVRKDVLEDRPTDIHKFKAIVETFKNLNKMVESVEKKIEQGRKVVEGFQSALKEAQRAATWRGLAASAHHEQKNAAHEALTLAKCDAEERALLLREKSKMAEACTNDMKAEIHHLTSLQHAHDDHQQNAQAQQDRMSAERKTIDRNTDFDRELKNLSRMLQNVSGDPLIAKWKVSLHAVAERLQKNTGTQSTLDVEFLQKTMQELSSLAKQIGEELDTTNVELRRNIEEITRQISVKESGLKRAKTGRSKLSDPTIYLIDELKDHGLDPVPVCDLVRVTNVSWQPAIEAYLGKNVEALLMREEEEDKAFDIYRGLQNQRAIYGVKVVRTSRMRLGMHVSPDTIASLIDGTNQAAVAYLRGKLGNLKQASHATALKNDRSLTVEGMLVGPGDFERLRLDDEGGLKIGAGARTQMDSLVAEIRTLRLEIQACKEQLLNLTNLRAAAGSLSSDETTRLILTNARNLLEALQERDVIRQRTSNSVSTEYQSLCETLAKSREALPSLENEQQLARDAAVREEEVVRQLGLKFLESAIALREVTDLVETYRTVPDYDRSFASDQWDNLIEQFNDDYNGMATHCEGQAKRCDTSVQRHTNQAQTLLGIYLSEQKEVVSKEVHDEWRLAKTWIEQQVRRLEETDLPQQKERAQEAYLASQETFRQDVAHALNANLKLLKSTIDRLNKSLMSTPAFTNGERYQFIYEVRSDLKPLHKFIKDVADFGIDGSLFGDPGSVPPQFEALLKEKSESGNASVKSPLDDYREFYDFDIRIDRDDPETGIPKKIGLLSKRIGPGSGGEHRAPLYVIAGAALSSAYRMDSENRDGIRLIMLDEAFDKMDTPNIIATMKYLEELGLQVLMASPGENLPTLTAFLHRYYEIQKDPDRHVIEVKERLVSEGMRLQYREDLWEFHPELLEDELNAVRQDLMSKSSLQSGPNTLQ